MDRLHLLYQETEALYNSTTLSPQLCELRNLITIGYLITRSASMRRESRGLHYTTDFPNHKPFVQTSLCSNHGQVNLSGKRSPLKSTPGYAMPSVILISFQK